MVSSLEVHIYAIVPDVKLQTSKTFVRISRARILTSDKHVAILKKREAR